MVVIALGWTHDRGMKPDKITREAAVAYARKELMAILAHVAEIENELPAQEHELTELLIRLEDLHAGEPHILADKREELVRYEFNCSMRKGLTPSEYVPNVSPYVAHIESLIDAAANDLVAYKALSIHSANLIGENHVMIPQLRLFVVEVMRGQRTEPSARGAPKLHPSRDRILHALLMDIAERFGLRPTRNKASAAISACDIVAEAMPKNARLPKSYVALERIWFRGQRKDRFPI